MSEAQKSTISIIDFDLWYKADGRLFAKKECQGPKGFTREEVEELAPQVLNLLGRGQLGLDMPEIRHFSAKFEGGRYYIFIGFHGAIRWPRLTAGTPEQYVSRERAYFGRTNDQNALLDL